MPVEPQLEVPALVVHQWLRDWDSVRFSTQAGERRRKPEPYFFAFTLSARQLRRLSTIYRRQAVGPRVEDVAVQRTLDKQRRDEIRRFVQGGFPWSELSEPQKRSADYSDLRMPGWLPTTILANILPRGAVRNGVTIDEEDVIQIAQREEGLTRLVFPRGLEQPGWQPAVAPIEIIDGQHRLWAFDERDDLDGEYQLPVVAFYNLDATWQAYLFYIINIKPKRINTSLAFDLYPLLRIQDWLEKSIEGAAIYRETRAQELTEVLWSHPLSPWRDRINMLGARRAGPVTQAAFIRALIASYIKRWEGRGTRVGGLFGAELHPGRGDLLQWSRPQQGAFLLLVWIAMSDALRNTTAAWAEDLRQYPVQRHLPRHGTVPDLDLAFESPYSLLATDQGVRGYLHVTNDMAYVASDELSLANWEWPLEAEESTEGDINAQVTEAFKSLQRMPVAVFVREIALLLSEFDWRTSSTPFLPEPQRRAQMIFRGSGGYKELRRQLLDLLSKARDERVKQTAIEVRRRLRY